MKKNNKGITLIALVVTIIVLLILAGITIATLTNDNGIFSNAQKAKSTNAIANADEQMKLAYMSVRTQIATETATNSSYNATATDYANELALIAAKDLNAATSNDSAKSSYVGNNYNVDVLTATEGGKAITYIQITYTDSAIKADNLQAITKSDSGLSDDVSPADGSMTSIIKLDTQNATYYTMKK